MTIIDIILLMVLIGLIVFTTKNVKANLNSKSKKRIEKIERDLQIALIRAYGNKKSCRE